MSAIKEKIEWYQHLVDANREKGICDPSLERDLEVAKETSDRLDEIEKKLKPDTERSCDEPAQEQGGDDYRNPPADVINAMSKVYEWCSRWSRHFQFGQLESRGYSAKEIADLRARLEQAEKEIGEWEARLSSILVTGILDDYTGKDVRSWLAEYKSNLEQAEAKVNELTAELEKQKASAFETGELALKRGFEIERLEKENTELKRKLSEVKP